MQLNPTSLEAPNHYQDFPWHILRSAYRYQCPGVVSPSHKWWTITDRRTGKAMFGHA
jgi:hypothetical protein